MTRMCTLMPLLALALTASACANNHTELPAALNAPVLTGPPGVMKSPEQQVTEQATAAISHYYDVLSRVTTGTAQDSDLGSVASGAYLGQLAREIHDLKGPNVTITGSVRAGAITPVKVVAPQDNKKDPIPGQASAELRVCEDRSTLNITGKPAGAPPAQTRLRRFVLVNPSWPAAGTWTITTQFAMPNTSCASAY